MKKEKKKEDSNEVPDVRDLDLGNLGYGESEDELDNYQDFVASSSGTRRKNVPKKGPIQQLPLRR